MSNFIYDTDDSLESKYYLPTRYIGAPTSPQTANQLDQMTKLLNQGIQNVEVGAISPDIFEQIPKQHFREMNRLAKLTDSRASVHAPMVDPAGFTQQGWDEFQRRQNEEQIKGIIERSHDLDDKGNVPITLHVTSAPFMANRFQKEGLTTHKGEPTEVAMTAVVDQATGEIVPLKHEVKQYLTGKETWDIDRSLRNLNKTRWDNDILKLMAYQKEKEEIKERMNQVMAESGPLFVKNQYGSRLSESEKAKLQNSQNRVDLYRHQMGEYDIHIVSGINELANRYEKSLPEGKEKKGIVDNLRKIGEQYEKQERQEVEIFNNFIKKYSNELAQIRDEGERRKRSTEIQELAEAEISRKIKDRISPGQLLAEITKLAERNPPPIYKKIDEFALEKTAETISNSALYAYDKFGSKAPIISLENVYPEMPLSRAESLRKTIEESRKAFAKKLVKEKGLDNNEAKEVAKKLIGATWDVGHINLLRRAGYKEEDIVKEAEKIAKVVKHIHLTDNFGFSDSHLPPGMGDVPIKEILRTLEKEGHLEGKDIRHIVEAGGFVQHFQTSPFPYALEGLNSPVYKYDTANYWNQIRSSYGSYLMGYGDILPDTHFRQLYGAGFSGLPRELGGQVGGERSRFAGTPNA